MGRRRALALAVAGTLAMALAMGCGGSESGSGAATTTASSSLDPSEALLRLSDMPTGWTELSADDYGGGPGACGIDLDDEPGERDEVLFQDPSGNELVNHDVLVPRTVDRADRIFDEIDSALAGCSEWKTTADDGTPLTFEIAPASFPALGSETTAVRLSATHGGIELGGLAIASRAGGAISFVVDFGLLVDPDQTADWASTGVERLQER